MRALVADINNCEQNHPEMVVDDLLSYVPADVTRRSLKYRGVNKWLRVRLLLIQLKHKWLRDLKEIDEVRLAARKQGDWKTYYKLSGYHEALIDCRQQVRALCHSPRNVDFPENRRDRGGICVLPPNFPKRPHKRWFCGKGYE